ncbi:MAG: Crp/Fnr family transcriptional regulator [Gammaproteobacteria bacterium]|nr:Crp/Fnr family transcriptional regulator [Gammaproteobacteria bacterium]
MTIDDFDINAEALRQLPLFRQLDAQTVTTIADAGRALNVARTARILNRGDNLDGFYVVFAGSLKMYILSCDGAERILRILRTGDSFGEAMMFNGFDSPVFVDALTDSQVAYIPHRLVADVLAQNPVFIESMFRGMSRLLLDFVRDIESCCLMNAKQRTVAYLLRLAEHRGPHDQQVTLPASKWVVASMLNLAPETFSRELHRLQADGLIEIVRRTIHVRDMTGLMEIVDGAAAVSVAT